ncbi:MAG: helix-turn-helix domain-containing protein [Methanomicrobia archaeon]|nr:helix-turn-helix domain-containing protein [Methanomicrobia archaeon]
MKQWMTVKEAADILGTTERTIYRQLKSGKIESRVENDRRLVAVNCPDTVLTSENQYVDFLYHLKQLLSEKDARIEQQQHEIEYLRNDLAETHQRTDQIIQQMQADFESTKERSDTIILQLTRQLDALTEQNQLLLEDLRPKQRWYHRLLVWNNA